jgi:hypothetical protein
MIDGPGVGDCPKRPEGLGHVWAGAMATGDRENPCHYCGASGRDYFAQATGERAKLFRHLTQPDSVKAWKGHAGG